MYVTYNGDFFDFPFVEKRAAKHDMDIYQELGFKWVNHSAAVVLASLDRFNSTGSGRSLFRFLLGAACLLDERRGKLEGGCTNTAPVRTTPNLLHPASDSSCCTKCTRHN